MASSSGAGAQATLTEAELAKRRVELDRRQQAFIHSILTSRSLPKRQSTIAGGSGLTNELFRTGEEIEATRQAKLLRASKEEQERTDAAAELAQRQREIALKSDKKRGKRLKKKQRLEKNKDDAKGKNSSDDESAASDDDSS
jgi:hypothetical protein